MSYVVGIDLGTTNSVVAYIDLAAGEQSGVQAFNVPQIINPGEVQDRAQLPSFCYLAGDGEFPAGSLALPWVASERDYAVGEFARRHGEKSPARLIASAKSWLSHVGVDRQAAILPFNAPDGVRKISPLEATTRYLRHIVDAWNVRMSAGDRALRLEQQDVLITVPASFDEGARQLTATAAAAAGLAHVTLLEEPQAAFYSWLQAQGDGWRHQLVVGDVILVCDVGGGTTDFTLITVAEQDGNLQLERKAVGEHILLGGDNMDLALAGVARGKLEQQGSRLDTSQTIALWHAARLMKERLLGDPTLPSGALTIAGRGSRLIGGSLNVELTREDVTAALLDGFFPAVAVSAQPAGTRRTGLQELGLNYAADTAIPRHLAKFLTTHAGAVAASADAPFARPTCVLYNGGVFKARPLQDRLTDTLNGWLSEVNAPAARVLAGGDLDRAVARGAAYYGLVRRGRGVRIRGGTARSYYVGIESAMPAAPGFAPPTRALCVAPFGMEEGTAVEVPERRFGLRVGEPAEFRFLSATSRHDDRAGDIIDDWEFADIEELAPVQATLPAGDGLAPGSVLPVTLHSRVSEVGTLELAFVSADNPSQRWLLEFNYRAVE